MINLMEKMRRGAPRLLRTVLRDTVFGLQDGLVSTVGALTGIAAGSQDRRQILLAGFVIVAVESLSMGAGAYLSSKSQKEYWDSLIAKEKESIERDPEGERREVRAMYGARGYSDAEIALIEARLFKDKNLLLEDMAHKELGICPDAGETPAANGLAMGIAYVAGGAVPVLPYLFFPMSAALAVSVVGTFVALFGVGGLKGKLVDRSPWRSGAEMLAVAGLAALVGYAIGRALGSVNF